MAADLMYRFNKRSCRESSITTSVIFKNAHRLTNSVEASPRKVKIIVFLSGTDIIVNKTII